MYWGKKNQIFLTCFIAMFAPRWWSGTKPARTLRQACRKKERSGLLLATHRFSLRKCLFGSNAHFLIRFLKFFLLWSCFSSLYNLDLWIFSPILQVAFLSVGFLRYAEVFPFDIVPSVSFYARCHIQVMSAKTNVKELMFSFFGFRSHIEVLCPSSGFYVWCKMGSAFPNTAEGPILPPLYILDSSVVS